MPKVVALRLLLARLYLVGGAGFQLLSLLLLLGQIVEIALIVVFRQRQPVHHVTAVVQFEERHQLVTNLIDHLGRQREVQRLASHRLQLVGNALDIVVD